MSSKQALWLCAAGLAIGLLAGGFGVGGGILAVPVLIMVFNKRPHDATVTSLAVIVPTALVAAITYDTRLKSEAGTGINLGIAAWVAIGAVLGSAGIGVPLAQKVSGRTLNKTFGVLLILVSLRMCLMPHHEGQLTQSHVAMAFCGVLIGAMSGFFGVGGGIIAVPLFTMVFGMTQRVAQGTSVAMALPACLAGVTRAHFSPEVDVDWRAAGVMAPASMVGSLAGAWLAGGSPDRLLQHGFAVLLVLTALRMVGVFAWLRERLTSLRARDRDV